MGILIGIHVIVCLLLISIILIQRGRGGGLVESFSGVESMFGPKTNTFLTRTTSVLVIMFFITCLSLAFLSARRSRSLMQKVKPPEPSAVDIAPIQKEILQEPLPIQESLKPETTETE